MRQDLRPIPYNKYQRTAINTNTTGWYFKEEHTIAIRDNEKVYIPFREECTIAIKDNTSTKTKTQDQKGQREHMEELTRKIPTKDLRPIPDKQYQTRAINTNTRKEGAVAISDNTLTKIPTKNQRKEDLTNESGLVFQSYRSKKKVNRVNRNDQNQTRAINTNTIKEGAVAISDNTPTKIPRKNQRKEDLTNENGLVFQSYRSKKKANRVNRNDQRPSMKDE